MVTMDEITIKINDVGWLRVGLVIIMLLLNVWVWTVYGWDKWRATKSGWRVSEKVLLWWMVIAPIGGAMGMKLFRHKTAKSSFKWRAVVCFVLGILLYAGVVWGCMLWE
ncbi:DUF1294 domain-containing protein [Poriferisphaera sp. WC338]|uniref:DUF1294 domain-containing protein n=1 Tax=Poriferisphaera sp. WC338 TaxID=3425129 RepID=UPI003D812E32